MRFHPWVLGVFKGECREVGKREQGAGIFFEKIDWHTDVTDLTA